MEEDIHERYIFDVSPESNEAVNDEVFERIKRRIGIEDPQLVAANVHFSKRWYAVAATVSGLVLLAALSWFYFQQPSSILYKTSFGETRTIGLPDGSLVTLNANSSLRLMDNFEDQRQVWLKGEAFFEVEEVRNMHETGFIKFIVHTERLDVEVLGTAFNVQDWRQKTQVVLTSGKVKLKSANKQEMTMQPGDLAEISEGEISIEKKEVNPVLYTSWKENKLFCEDTPLSEIADLVRNRYGREVIFQQKNLKDITVTGTLPLQNLTLLTEVLQESLKINILANEGKLVISKNEKPAQ
jgi:ferric-dicitrate binding protein FerR (iron transport regulator)